MAKPAAASEPATGDEAAEVEEQQEQAAAAEEKREKTAEKRAMSRKDYVEGSDPPSQVTKGGETAYSHERLTADSMAFLGEPPHVVAGALYGNDEAYLTLAETTTLINTFKAREV